jgi:hypothetical protein
VGNLLYLFGLVGFCVGWHVVCFLLFMANKLALIVFLPIFRKYKIPTKGLKVISRLGHILIVIAMVFAANSACFCWVQMTQDMGCHASEKMASCCCDQEAEVADDTPIHQTPVLPPTFQLVELDEVVSVVGDSAVTASPNAFSAAGHKAKSLLRSPLHLFVLYATFLI